MPRRAVAVLKGESLLNDATAILIFTTAVALQTRGGIDAGLALQLGLAVPGGVLLGVALAKVLQYLQPFFSRMVSGYLLEYLFSFGAWIIAEHLHLSAVLCVVAFGMTLARSENLGTPPRMRLHNTAVSHTTVFVLNVLAFLLMGLQAKEIVSAMAPAGLREAAWFAAAVVVCLVAVRMAWVLLYNWLVDRVRSRRDAAEPTSLREGVLLG